MIQCSEERFVPGHRDHIFTIVSFNISELGECKIQVFPYQDDTNPPTVYITNDYGIICGLRLDKPLFWGREYSFSQIQKNEVNNIVNSETSLNGLPEFPVWKYMRSIWKDTNDRLDKIDIPLDPPDYTKLP